MSLILASTSPYRQQLLHKLGLPFTAAPPHTDEQAKVDETAPQLVQRLAKEKAAALARLYPQDTIIGSDQVAVVDNEIMGKPGEHSQAIAQLQRSSGNQVVFYTGLALYHGPSQHWQVDVEPFTVHFRDLSTSQIEHYLHTEQPYQCAGSFKSEGLGITLFERFDGRDPNCLVGLPLMRLIDMLLAVGIDPLGPHTL